MQTSFMQGLALPRRFLKSVAVRATESKSAHLAIPSSLDLRERREKDEPILPGKEGHRPWMTTYYAPSLAPSSIRTGKFGPLSSGHAAVIQNPVDERARKKVLEIRKRSERVKRLGRAWDLSIEYRHSNSSKSTNDAAPSCPNPVSLKGWTTLIEDKIEVRSFSFILCL